MLVIRFLRVGKKKQPSYKIVVTDKKNPPRAGRFVEQVGFYNPLTKEKNLKPERVKHWLSVGAKPSDTVYNLLVSEKIIEGKKIPQHKKSKKEAEVKSVETLREEVKKEGVKAEEKPVEAPKKEVKTEKELVPEKVKEKEGETPVEIPVETAKKIPVSPEVPANEGVNK